MKLSFQAWMVLTAAVLIGQGCERLPRDPRDTLERVRGGTLRAGITEHPPWTLLASNQPSGIEVELLEAFARELGAEIDWRPGSESELVEALKRRELDVVVGGIETSTPWKKHHAGTTRPYVELPTGKLLKEKHILLVPQGENRWILTLDQFLARQEAEVHRLLAESDRP